MIVPSNPNYQNPCSSPSTSINKSPVLRCHSHVLHNHHNSCSLPSTPINKSPALHCHSHVLHNHQSPLSSLSTPINGSPTLHYHSHVLHNYQSPSSLPSTPIKNSPAPCQDSHVLSDHQKPCSLPSKTIKILPRYTCTPTCTPMRSHGSLRPLLHAYASVVSSSTTTVPPSTNSLHRHITSALSSLTSYGQQEEKQGRCLPKHCSRSRIQQHQNARAPGKLSI